MKLVALAFAGAMLVGCAESPSPKAAKRDSALPTLPATKASVVASAAPPAPIASAPSVVDAAATRSGPCANGDTKRTATSPDGHVTVFVVVDTSKTVATFAEDMPHEDLCVAKDGGAPRILVAGHEAWPNEGVERTLGSFGQLVFSPDGVLLFFSSAAWVTSGAAHVVDLATGKEKFLFDGAVEAAIVSGAYKGSYLANHFRLDQAHPISSPQYRGRMMSWSVVSKDGKTIRKLTDAEAKRIARSDVGGKSDVGPESD